MQQHVDALDRLLNSSTARQIMNLMRENVELRAELKTQQAVAAARAGVQQLKMQQLSEQTEHMEREAREMKEQAKRIQREVEQQIQSAQNANKAAEQRLQRMEQERARLVEVNNGLKKQLDES
ncbi:MAG: hypothetical protein KDA45_11505, partial [Planctomycetales bacterium]|nr:hypothetical protein [Planctomycetales bacterium]